MNCNAKIKVETQVILLENDVFLYKIPSGIHPGHCHKAKDWDISNPKGGYKLILLADDSDSCHIQLKDGNGDFFGYGVINCHPGPSGSTSSSSITAVADSSRFFTTKIRKLSSGQDELIGIGFISRDDSSRLTKTLESYFTCGKRSSNQISKTDHSKESPASLVHDKVPSEPFQRKTIEYNDCQQCPNRFATRRSFSEYSEKIHGNPSIVFYCDTEDCGKRFFSQLTLDNHKRTEHQDRIQRFKTEYPDSAMGSRGEQLAIIPQDPPVSQNPVDIHKKVEHLDNPPPIKIMTCEVDQGLSLGEKQLQGNIGIYNLVDNPNGAVYHNELETLFWCPICPPQAFTTTDRKELLKHLKNALIHVTGKPRMCLICSLVFTNGKCFLDHAHVLHFACRICMNPFTTEGKLRRHVRKVHKEILMYQCHRCPSNFDVQELFVKHLKSEHLHPAAHRNGERSCIDPLPEDPLASQQTLDSHKRTERLESPSPTKSMKCKEKPDCDEKHQERNSRMDYLLDNPIGAVYHDELHTLYWCPICPSQSFATTDRKALLKHLKDESIHGHGRHRICGICRLLFNNMERFQYHANVFHYTCSVCFAPLPNEDRLRLHVSDVHKQTLQYQCHLCSSHFTVHEFFIEHYKTEHPDPIMDSRREQSAINPLPQDSPPTKRIKRGDDHDWDENQQEWNVDDLIDNPNGAVYHDELKTAFWCPICPSQSFTTTDKNDLIRHFRRRRIHGRQKPRICGICSLVFNTVERFLYHANIFHFTCSVCKISFKDDEHKLRYHVLKSHGQTLTYQCHRCPSNFTDHELFVEHLKTEHLHPDVDSKGEQSDSN